MCSSFTDLLAHYLNYFNEIVPLEILKVKMGHVLRFLKLFRINYKSQGGNKSVSSVGHEHIL